MQNITLKELFMSADELCALESKVAAGDADAQAKLLLYHVYGPNPASDKVILKTVTELCDKGNPMALLYAAFLHEHALGTPKNYCKAVEYYSEAYDALNPISATKKRSVSTTKAEADLEKIYSAILKNISQIVSIPGFCVFEKGAYNISLNQKSLKTLQTSLSDLINDVNEFKTMLEMALPGMGESDSAQWEYRLQDTVLVPVEIFKTITARIYLHGYLAENEFVSLPEDKYFANAIGRCIVDDDEIDDNDYIIAGLLQMAGHDNSPLWQYRVGLWFENSDSNLEPQTAASWYEKAKDRLHEAKVALKRLKGSSNYKILQGRENGTVKECQKLLSRTASNPQNNIVWLIECAMRGDEAALIRLEQKHISPAGDNSVLKGDFKPELYYPIIAEEIRKDEKISDDYFADKLAESKQCQKEIYLQRAREEAARKKAEEEARKREEARIRAEEEAKRKAEEEARKREEARIRAEQEAIRRAEEDARRKEEAKRQAELEAIRKIEEEKRQAELAEKRKEAARKRAEALARKKEEERILAEQEAKRKAEEAKRKEEEERQRTEEACKRYIAEIESLKDQKDEILAEFKSECQSKATGLENSLASAYRSLSSKLDAYRPKIWHRLFCSIADKNIDDFLRKEKSTNSDLTSNLQTELADAKSVAKKIDNLLRKPAERNETALKAYVTKLKKLIDDLSDAKGSCKKQIKAVEKQITYLTSEISYSDFKCEFYFLKTLFVLSAIWAIVSLIRIFFTDSFGPFIQLCISGGVMGSAISLDNPGDRSFKVAFKGFTAGFVITIVAELLIMLLISWVGSWFDGSESEEEYGDSASLVEERYYSSLDDTENTSDTEDGYAAAIAEAKTQLELQMQKAEEEMARAMKEAEEALALEIEGMKLGPVYSTEDHRYGLWDKNNQKMVVPTQYDYIDYPDSNGMFRVENEGKQGYFDKYGRLIIEIKYDRIHRADKDGWRKVELDGKFGYLDNSGKEVVPPIYDSVGSWKGGKLKVKMNGKTGYVDRFGNMVKPLK